jgi:hypothetical protein
VLAVYFYLKITFYSGQRWGYFSIDSYRDSVFYTYRRFPNLYECFVITKLIPEVFKDITLRWKVNTELKMESEYRGRIIGLKMESEYRGRIIGIKMESEYRGRISGPKMESEYRGRIIGLKMEREYRGRIIGLK